VPDPIIELPRSPARRPPSDLMVRRRAGRAKRVDGQIGFQPFPANYVSPERRRRAAPAAD
jgi:hypothetical protein